MKIIETKAEMRAFSLAQRQKGKAVGLVPTMGALHEGHLSLIRAARSDCGIAVVSIFVNPAQFAPNEDLAKYPRSFQADCAACERCGADAVFAPSSEEMYPPGSETFVVQDRLAGVLEGASRPAHFRGVLTVVLKLFNVAAPQVAYFGQKDYQQTVVIRRMVADLDVPVEVRVLPTVREADGLAMSSRNRYLNPDERRQAVCLSASLDLCSRLAAQGSRSTDELKARMRARIDKEPSALVDYVEIVDPDTLGPVAAVRSGDVALVAVLVGTTRLIDNVILAAGV